MSLLSWIARLFTPLGGILSASAVLAGLVVSFAYSQQKAGARREAARQETANATASKKAAAAARRSIDPAATGVLNPNYRAD